MSDVIAFIVFFSSSSFQATWNFQRFKLLKAWGRKPFWGKIYNFPTTMYNFCVQYWFVSTWQIVEVGWLIAFKNWYRNTQVLFVIWLKSQMMYHIGRIKFCSLPVCKCLHCILPDGTTNVMPFCLPTKCLHWDILHHCWNIVNIFHARICAWYLP